METNIGLNQESTGDQFYTRVKDGNYCTTLLFKQLLSLKMMEGRIPYDFILIDSIVLMQWSSHLEGVAIL